MAERDYTLTLTAAGAAQFRSDIEQIIAHLSVLDKLCDTIPPKVKGMFKGVAGDAKSVKKAVDELNASLASANKTVAASANAVTDLGTAATKTTNVLNVLNSITNSFNTTNNTLNQTANILNATQNRLNNTLNILNQTTNKVDASTKTYNRSSQTLNNTIVNVTGSTDGACGSFLRMAGTAVALQAVRMVARHIGDAMNDAREYAEKTAVELHKIRDDVRELKAIRGDKTTDDTVKAAEALMTKTGATKDEAIAFDKMFHSVLPNTLNAVNEETGVKNWQLNAADTEQAEKEMLKYATANGIDAQTMGRLIPSLGLLGPVKSLDDLKGQVMSIHAMGSRGVGEFGPINKVINRLAPSMVDQNGGNAFRSVGELAAAVSAETVKVGSEREATQAMRQSWRELSAAGTEKKRATFKKYGIVPGKDDYLSSLDKIAPLILGAKGGEKGERQALLDAGFSNGGANNRIIADVHNRELIRSNIAEQARAADPREFDRRNAAYERENAHRFSDAMLAVANIERGNEMDRLSSLRDDAEASLSSRHKINTEWTNVVDKAVTWNRLGFLGQNGKDARKDREVRSILREAVPGIDDRFPQLREGFISEGAESLDLAKVTNSLSPEELEAVRGVAKRRAEQGPTTPSFQRGMDPIDARMQGRIAADVANRGQAAVGIDQANVAIGGALSGPLGAILAATNAQTRVLMSMERKMGGKPGGAVGGPLRADGGAFQPERAGDH